MDPLSVLRDFVSSGRKWAVDGDEVVFGDLCFRKEEQTAWKAAGGRRGYYKLSELIVLVENAGLPYLQYVKKCGELKVTSFVGKLDFDQLLKYLQGQVATSEQIDQSLLISRASTTLPSAGFGAALKRPAAGERAAGEGVLDRLDLHLGDVSRSTGIDGQTLQELKEVLATKKQRLEEGAGEEELWKADEAMHRILKAGEQRVNDRNSVLLTPNADYTMALTVLETVQKKAKEASQKPGASGSSASGRKPSSSDHRGGSAAPGGSSANATPRSRTETPIIIVPSDPSALINMTNVADFLENANLVGPQERGKSRDAMRRVKQLVITKTLAGETRAMKFKVVDNPVWLQDSEWEQVVAVFSNGKAWQFSEWKYKTPVDLFHRCFGAVVQYDDEPLRGEVKGWNVKFYKVNKTKRHMDGTAVSAFWIHLTEWIKVNKPALLR